MFEVILICDHCDREAARSEEGFCEYDGITCAAPMGSPDIVRSLADPRRCVGYMGAPLFSLAWHQRRMTDDSQE